MGLLESQPNLTPFPHLSFSSSHLHCILKLGILFGVGVCHLYYIPITTYWDLISSTSICCYASKKNNILFWKGIINSRLLVHIIILKTKRLLHPTLFLCFPFSTYTLTLLSFLHSNPINSLLSLSLSLS